MYFKSIDVLPEQCKKCDYLLVIEPRLNGKHCYICGEHGPKHRGDNCPNFKPSDKEGL